MTDKKQFIPNALTLDWNDVSSYDYSENDCKSPTSTIATDNILNMQYSPDLVREEHFEAQKSEWAEPTTVKEIGTQTSSNLFSSNEKVKKVQPNKKAFEMQDNSAQTDFRLN